VPHVQGSFLGGLLAAVAFAYAWYAIPGLMVLRFLPWLPRRPVPDGLLFAPLVGMVTFGTATLPVFYVVPYRREYLLACFAAFVILLWWRGRGVPANSGVAGPQPCRRVVWAVVAACFGVATLACVHVIPWTAADGAVYTGAVMHDHAKVAIVDAIAREGLPPITPFYAPGAPIPLNYYFGWHYLASQVRLVTGIAGWPTHAAFVWLTYAIAVSFCAGMALQLTGRARAAVSAIALSISGCACDALAPLARPFPRLSEVIGAATRFHALPEQAIWVPQHVLAAVTVVLVLVMLSHLDESPLVSGSLVLGLSCAGAFGCSVWVAMVLAVAGPVILVVLFASARHRPEEGRRAAALLGLAALVAIGFSLPIVAAALAGPTAPTRGSVALFLLHPLPRPHSALVQILAYWVLYVAAVLGVTFFAGLFGLAIAPLADRRQWRRFRLLSAISALVSLSICQFARSTIYTNDLGWRANLVATVVLTIWGAAGLEWLVSRAAERAGWPRRHRRALLVLSAMGLAVGLAACPRGLPGPPAGEDPLRGARRRLAKQERAWQVVREHAGPSELVQANPRGAFSELTPWPINISAALFSDRRSAILDPVWGWIYAHRAEPRARQVTINLVGQVFSANPSAESVAALRDLLHVKVLLLDPADPVWPGTAIAATGRYRQVYRDSDFCVLSANP
jgi:hypothetical protein